MWKGPKGLTPWVDLSRCQHPENVLLAGLGWGFHLKITLWCTNKTPLIYVKRAKEKNITKLLIRVPGVRNGQCKALPLPATPKGVTKWAFIYVKRAKAPNNVISYLRVPRVRNGQGKQFHARLRGTCLRRPLGTRRPPRLFEKLECYCIKMGL